MKSYLTKIKAQDEAFKLIDLETIRPTLEEIPEEEGINPTVGFLQAALLESIVNGIFIPHMLVV